MDYKPSASGTLLARGPWFAHP